MKIFEYLYLYIKILYTKWGEKDMMPGLYGLVIIAVLIMFNCLSLDWAFNDCGITSSTLISKPATVIIFLAVLGFMMIYLRRIKQLDRVDAKILIGQYSRITKMASIAYISISIAFFLFTISYHPNK